MPRFVFYLKKRLLFTKKRFFFHKKRKSAALPGSPEISLEKRVLMNIAEDF
jgi:hypothetical protein